MTTVGCVFTGARRLIHPYRSPRDWTIGTSVNIPVPPAIHDSELWLPKPDIFSHIKSFILNATSPFLNTSPFSTPTILRNQHNQQPETKIPNHHLNTTQPSYNGICYQEDECRKQAVSKGKKTQKPQVKKWDIGFLHGHKFIKRKEMIRVIWIGWSQPTWEPVSQLKKDLP
ncbi:hypothetical protein DL98DRAFT_571429 [Cadophora sp. DSE1049]|nr:hypothetical protein DL98DRAFT_571429 [Cadophora sp. DSE1049]